MPTHPENAAFVSQDGLSSFDEWGRKLDSLGNVAMGDYQSLQGAGARPIDAYWQRKMEQEMQAAQQQAQQQQQQQAQSQWRAPAPRPAALDTPYAAQMQPGPPKGPPQSHVLTPNQGKTYRNLTPNAPAVGPNAPAPARPASYDTPYAAQMRQGGPAPRPAAAAPVITPDTSKTPMDMNFYQVSPQGPRPAAAVPVITPDTSKAPMDMNFYQVSPQGPRPAAAAPVITPDPSMAPMDMGFYQMGNQAPPAAQAAAPMPPLRSPITRPPGWSPYRQFVPTFGTMEPLPTLSPEDRALIEHAISWR